LERLKKCLILMFGVDPGLVPVKPAKGLPALYPALFRMWLGTVREMPCLFAYARSANHLTPAQIERYMTVLSEHFHVPAVYVGERLAPHEPERLVSRGVPFLVPGKQMFLPFAGTLLKQTRQHRRIEHDYLGTCAQLIVLGVLQNYLAAPVRIMDVVSRLGVSRSTAISALFELERFGLGMKEKTNGKEIGFHFIPSGKELWDEAQPFLRNPCKRTVGLETLPDDRALPLAGVDALAEETMLNATKSKCFAMSLSEFRKSDIRTVSAATADCHLQLWLYRPLVFEPGRIDMLSLYLTLKNDPDERVQIALNKRMEEIRW